MLAIPLKLVPTEIKDDFQQFVECISFEVCPSKTVYLLSQHIQTSNKRNNKNTS